MVIAITPGQLWDWVHESDLDKPEEDQTIFQLRVLTSRQNDWVQNQYAGSKAGRTRGKKGGDDRLDVVFRAGDYRRASIIAGLVGVTNLRGADGLDVVFETRQQRIGGEVLEVPIDALLDRIPPEVQVDLAGAITDGPRLQETDRKN